MRRSTVAALALLVVAVLAGCVNATETIPDHLQVRGTDAFQVPGPDDWAYDGQGVQRVDGSIEIDVRNEANEGTVVAELTVQGTDYRFVLDRFSGNASHQDGGINHGFMEHGDTGHGHRLIPASYAVSAGWGIGTATADGEPLLEAQTGARELDMHYMFFEGGIRDDDDQAIYKADRDGFYTPSQAGDADVDPDDREIHFRVKQVGAQLFTFRETYDDTVSSADYTESYPVPVKSNRSTIDIPITTESPQEGLVTGNLTFELVDPNGTTVAQAQVGGPGQSPRASLRHNSPEVLGNYTLEVSGSGTQLRYEARTTVAYPDPTFMHFYFETVELLNVDEMNLDTPLN